MKTEKQGEIPKRPLEGGTDSSGPPAGDLFASTVKSVCDGIGRAAQETGEGSSRFVEIVTGVVHSSMRGAVEAGGSLVLGAKAILVGVLRATGEREAAALKTISHTSLAVIRTAAQLSADLSASLKGLILGAIASAKDVGVERAQAATSAAQGALEGAGEAGSAAVDTMRRALREDIGGIHVALPEPVRN